LWTVISNTNDGTEEVKARTLAANKAYSSLQAVLYPNKSTEIIQ